MAVNTNANLVQSLQQQQQQQNRSTHRISSRSSSRSFAVHLFRSAAAESWCVDPTEFVSEACSILYQRDLVSLHVSSPEHKVHAIFSPTSPASVQHHDLDIGTALCRDHKLRCSRDGTWVSENPRHLVSLVKSRGSVKLLA